MSAKFKFIFFVILSIFSTVATGIYFWQRYPSAPLAANNLDKAKTRDYTAVSSPTNAIVDPEHKKYKNIPIEQIDSVRQGTDPKALALDVFDTIEPRQGQGQRHVEVTYPQPNQALVTITQTQQVDQLKKDVKYRVEMTSFGRTLLASSPPMWQIVWAGSKRQCARVYDPNRIEVQPCN